MQLNPVSEDFSRNFRNQHKSRKEKWGVARFNDDSGEGIGVVDWSFKGRAHHRMEKRNKKSASPEASLAKIFSAGGRGNKQLGKLLSLAKNVSGNRLTVEQLAAKASLSPRHVARLFSKEMHVRPAQFLEALRVQAAIRCLEQTDDPVSKIATDCGFGSRASLYRAFNRLVHMSPAEYRLRSGKRSGGTGPEQSDEKTGSAEDDDQGGLSCGPGGDISAAL